MGKVILVLWNCLLPRFIVGENLFVEKKEVFSNTKSMMHVHFMKKIVKFEVLIKFLLRLLRLCS